MNIELEKYKVEILKISGFAMMTPFGRIFIQPLVVYREFNSPWFIFYCIVAIGLFLLGTIFVLRGYDILYPERRNKYD